MTPDHREIKVSERRRRLARYMTWTAEDLAEFNEALAAQRTKEVPPGLHNNGSLHSDR
jgi:hypothetical protein